MFGSPTQIKEVKKKKKKKELQSHVFEMEGGWRINTSTLLTKGELLASNWSCSAKKDYLLLSLEFWLVSLRLWPCTLTTVYKLPLFIQYIIPITPMFQTLV